MTYLKSLVTEFALELRSVFPCFSTAISTILLNHLCILYIEVLFDLQFLVFQRHEFPIGSHYLFFFKLF